MLSWFLRIGYECLCVYYTLLKINNALVTRHSKEVRSVYQEVLGMHQVVRAKARCRRDNWKAVVEITVSHCIFTYCIFTYSSLTFISPVLK